MPANRTNPIAAIVIVGAAGVALAGCMGPTYGTDKTAGAQLMEDLSSAMSLGGRKDPPINYAPRPDIVKPADTSVLPPPQENIAEASSQWPESPEERRQRVLAEIDAGERDPNFVTDPDRVAALGASEGPGRTAGGCRRVYLTDVPPEYCQPAETAAYGDLGPTEKEKERAAKQAQGEKTGWRRLVPWL
ncbi:hypothetical protein [Roseitalea sp. MMSF_3504]|nr:hypothetical protein [Roseitalea sp. MMSF_3504]